MAYRIAVVGSGGVGKSALTVRFLQGQFLERYDPTVEDAYRKQMEVDGDAFMLEIMDTAGQEEYAALRDDYMRRADGLLLVYSITDKKTFLLAKQLRQSLLQTKGVDWAPVVLVGNKKDLVDQQEQEQELEQQQQEPQPLEPKQKFEPSPSPTHSGTLVSSASGDCGVDAEAASGSVNATADKPVAITSLLMSKPAASPTRQVSREDAQAVANVWQCPFMETSAKTGENVKDIFNQLVREVHRVKTSAKSSKKGEGKKKQRKIKRDTSCMIL